MQFLVEKKQKKEKKLQKVIVSPVKKPVKPVIKEETEEPVGLQGTPYTDDLMTRLARLSVEEKTIDVATTNMHIQAAAALANSIDSTLPVEHLQLWTNYQPVNMLKYTPAHCHHHKVERMHYSWLLGVLTVCQGLEHCHIIHYGSQTRERCYDVTNPFILSYQKYQCKTHGNAIFSILNLDLKDSTVTPPVVSFERTIVTAQFLDYLFATIPSHSFNFSSLAKTILSGWVATLTYKIRMVCRVHLTLVLIFCRDCLPKYLQRVTWKKSLKTWKIAIQLIAPH